MKVSRDLFPNRLIQLLARFRYKNTCQTGSNIRLTTSLKLSSKQLYLSSLTSSIDRYE